MPAAGGSGRGEVPALGGSPGPHTQGGTRGGSGPGPHPRES